MSDIFKQTRRFTRSLPLHQDHCSWWLWCSTSAALLGYCSIGTFNAAGFGWRSGLTNWFPIVFYQLLCTFLAMRMRMPLDSDSSQYAPSDEEEIMIEDDNVLSSGDSESSDESGHTPPAVEMPSLHTEAKYIVFFSSLLNLISMCCCSVCGSRELQTTHTLIVSPRCCDYGEQRTWHSQPYIGNLCAGNILLSAANGFAGATVGRVPVPGLAVDIVTHGSEDMPHLHSQALLLHEPCSRR